MNGVLWILRSGAHWRDLPERYGKWKTVHKHFTHWAKAGVWEKVFAHLIEDPDNVYVALDSPLVRTQQQAATGRTASKKEGPDSGASRGGLTTRIHMAVDGSGRPLHVILTAGQRGGFSVPGYSKPARHAPRMLARRHLDHRRAGR